MTQCSNKLDAFEEVDVGPVGNEQAFVPPVFPEELINFVIG